MTNRDTNATWTYHNGTKHSYSSVRSDPHFLDWEIQPLPFKIYKGLTPIPLARDFPPSPIPALEAISKLEPPPGCEGTVDLRTLARVLQFSAGITKRKTFPGGEILFRAAACTGALYHIELYIVCGDLPELKAGVYHFGVHDSSLRQLRSGDFRSHLSQATGDLPLIRQAPATIICTGTFWRNAWKYQSRSYRHSYWDNGTILANMLAVAAASGLPARLVLGFADEEVNRLLDLDTEREVALSLIALGFEPERPIPPAPPCEPLNLPAEPLSKREVEYQAIGAIHEASSLRPEEVTVWRGKSPQPSMPEVSGELFPLSPLPDQDLPREPIEKVIIRRGSTRRFARESISRGQLSTILSRASRGIPADFLDPPGCLLNHLYLIVHGVEGLPPGAYVYHRQREALEQLKAGEFRREAGYLGLEQEIPGDASVNIYCIVDLTPILERWGNRGYRAAQLEGGILGGKFYLAAYALGLGASGLTFYDDEVIQFFAPHASGKSVMFLSALGKSAGRKVSPVSAA